MKKIICGILVAAVAAIVSARITATAPNPTFLWHLLATGTGCLAAAPVAALIGRREPGFSQAAELLCAASAVALFWPAVALVAAL